MVLIIAQLLLVLALLYVIGRLTYVGTLADEQTSRYHFLKSLGHLLWMFVLNGIVFLVLATLVIGCYTLGDYLLNRESYEKLDVSSDTLGNALGNFPGGAFLLLLLVLIFSTAITTFLMRAKGRKKTGVWPLTEEGYEIGEYFIQWITIYLAVYQFFFDGLQDLLGLLIAVDTAKEAFNIVLSPRNVNLVMQPVLISTWILVVMEKLRLRNSQQ